MVSTSEIFKLLVKPMILSRGMKLDKVILKTIIWFFWPKFCYILHLPAKLYILIFYCCCCRLMLWEEIIVTRHATSTTPAGLKCPALITLKYFHVKLTEPFQKLDLINKVPPDSSNPVSSENLIVSRSWECVRPRSRVNHW